MILFFSLGFVALMLLAVGVFFFLRNARRRRILDRLNTGILVVRLAKPSKSDRDFKTEISQTEQLLSVLSSFKRPFALEVAIAHVGEEIVFYAAVPRDMREVAIKQIQGLWGDAEVQITEDYNIFNPHGESRGAYLAEHLHYAVPLRTYADIGSDTFESILSGFSRIKEVGEGASLQIIVTSAGNGAKKSILQKIKALREGKSPGEVLGKSAGMLSDLGKTVSPKMKGGNGERMMVDEDIVAALAKKISKPLFNVNVRIVASAPNGAEADAILEGIAAGFSQFGAPQRNELKLIKPRNPAKFFYQFSFREFDEGQAMVLNGEEIASIFHFPISSTATPKIASLKFREAAPPANLPAEGIVLGESRYRGARKEVRLTKEDRRRHLYIIGQTGTGKSVTLTNLISQDIKNGGGVAVLDPNGDLIDDVLSRIPAERAQDVIVFDPGDLARPLALNMLEFDPAFPEQKTFIINELLNIFDILYNLKETGGPMFEQYVRYTLLLLMNDPSDGFTLMEVPRVLSDTPFRKQLLQKCTDPLVVDFWEKQAEKAGGEAALANMVPYITSKFNTFLANDFMRPIIAQSKSTLNFRQIMDSGKILLVNLSKGKIGELNAKLLGMLVVGKLQLGAFGRTDTPMEQRRDFYLYIDEFQNFTTPSIATILSEARKYRLCLTVAHQFVGQLREDIKSAIFGNVGSMLAFRIGAEDAEFIAKQFEPVFSQNDLINIANLNAYAKIIVNGVVSAPFNIFIPFPSPGDTAKTADLKELSRLKYGKALKDVEGEIMERYRRY